MAVQPAEERSNREPEQRTDEQSHAVEAAERATQTKGEVFRRAGGLAAGHDYFSGLLATV